MKRKFGFTLAEVLITLGIIGVVAAMTMPALIQKNHTNISEARLKKFYSSINQAVTLAEVTQGDKKDWTAADTDEFWEKYLKPYLKYTNYKNIRKENGNDWRLVFLPDGSAFVVDIYVAKNADGVVTWKTNGGHFIFCPEAKNCREGSDKTKWGRTQFVFAFWPNEATASMKYHKNKGVEPYLNAWDGKEESLYSGSSYSCGQGFSNFYCAAIIQHNGWKVPKDYPYKF